MPGGKIVALLRGRVVLLFEEADIVGRQSNVLHHRFFIALELGVSRQAALVYTQLLFPIYHDLGPLRSLVPRLGYMPLFFRRMIRILPALALVRLDIRFALFALESIELIPQGLVLLFHGLNQVHQFQDGAARTFQVLNRLGIESAQPHSCLSV